MGVKELRIEVLKNCDILQAILAFNYSLTKTIKSDLDFIRSNALHTPARGLRDIRDQLRSNLRNAIKTFGCLREPAEFAAIFINASRNGLPSIAKAVIDSRLFSNFCNRSADWNRFPPHLRLQAHFNWVTDGPLVFHYQLPEAMLYEDMALAYNLASETKAAASRVKTLGANVDAKKHAFYVRTAVLSSFYFVEAYLNGIAYDFFYKNEAKLSTKEKDILLEWDPIRDRQLFVSFDRKINEYPKIIRKGEIGVFPGQAFQ